MKNPEDISQNTNMAQELSFRASGPAFTKKRTQTNPYDAHMTIVESIKSSESELMANLEVEDNKYEYLMGLGKIQIIQKDEFEDQVERWIDKRGAKTLEDGTSQAIANSGPSPSFGQMQDLFKERKVQLNTDVEMNNRSNLPLINGQIQNGDESALQGEQFMEPDHRDSIMIRNKLDDTVQTIGPDGFTEYQQFHFKRRQGVDKYVQSLHQSVYNQRANHFNVILLWLLFLDLPQFLYFVSVILDQEDQLRLLEQPEHELSNLRPTIIANMAMLGFSILCNGFFGAINLCPLSDCLYEKLSYGGMTTFIFLREALFSCISFYLLWLVYHDPNMEGQITLRRLGEAMGWIRCSSFVVFIIVGSAAVCNRKPSKKKSVEQSEDDRYNNMACCAICFDDFKDDALKLVRIRCPYSHVVHSSCLYDWLNIHKYRHCPICKVNINEWRPNQEYQSNALDYLTAKSFGNQGLSVNSKLDEVKDAVMKAVKDFDPNATERDENLEFHETEAVSAFEMFNRFADGSDKFLLYNGFFWSFLFGAAMPGFSIIFGGLVDDLGSQQPGSGNNPMQQNTSLMFYVAIFAFVTSALYIASFSVFSESVVYKFKIEYLKNALEKDAAFYDEQNPNEMASKINKEAAALRRGCSEKVGAVNMSIWMFLFGFVAAFYFGWKYSLILLGGLPFIAVAGILFGLSMQSGAVQQMKAYAQSAGYAEQALQSIRIVHTYGNEMLELFNYTKYLDRARQEQFKSKMFVAFTFAFMFGVMYCFYAFSLYMGGVLRWEEIREGDELYTGGKVIAIMFSIMIGAMQLGNVGTSLSAIQQGRVATKLALNIIDQVPIVNPNKKGTIPKHETLTGKIEFKDVNFTYPTRPDVQVLKDFSCVFEPGQTTALVGPSGSGKSTIIQMIERFYKNDSGQILVDGDSIDSLDLREFRRLIGYVGQEPVLFNASIRENMKFAKPDASDEEIQEALEAANAWDFIQKIETKLDTIVGGSGGSLSGGQKQRVAIARAFLKKPRILLLDEATSALDKVNEGIVQNAIDNYRKQNPITIIVIAHRLSTIRDADKIVVLVNGRLTEMGNHEQLIATDPNGTYAEFCQKQASQEQYKPSTAEREKENEILKESHEAGETAEQDDEKQDDSGLTAEIKNMLKQADENDQKYTEEVDNQIKPLREKSDFMKVMAYNNPKIAIFFAVLTVAISGACQPFWGWLFADILMTLSVPVEMLKLKLQSEGKDAELWKSELEVDVEKLTVYMVILGGVTFVTFFFKSYLFGILGENVTLKVRQELYKSILIKHVGWFDEQENQSSVLTSAMAQESSIINGASSESLGPYTESMFALLGGLIIGFIFCWQEALITLACVPAIMVANYIGMEFEKGLTGATADSEKEANLLIGDAINNFKTIQSFGYEQEIIQKYVSYVLPVYKAGRSKHIKSGIAFGFSQFVIFCVFGLLFYAGGEVIEGSCETVVGTGPNDSTAFIQCSVEPRDVFIALFAIFFGANHAGMAMSLGPDIGKAALAAEKIFKIIDYPSKINAVEMDGQPEQKKLQKSEVQGKIEFKDVWFRYPTRKNEFVLKGLNLTINPNESVALVGESGCGKSTFVNLMMRFYDPDFGTVLLDDVDIKEYNLHDLRKAVSLVMQEPSIFNYSIKDNVLYGKLDARNSEILKATTIANCNEFIEKGQLDKVDESPSGLILEMQNNKQSMIEILGNRKYNESLEALKKLEELDVKKGKFMTVEGDIDNREKRGVENWNDESLSKGFEILCGIKGGKLSGGQKQRVAIARTLISEPKVLLLDEATSALDETSQAKVQQAIEQAMESRTTIIIAHRMTTIKKCDKVFLLEEGRVRESGNFDDLLNAGGAFSKLAAAKQE